MILRYLLTSRVTSSPDTLNICTKLLHSSNINKFGFENDMSKVFYSIKAKEKIMWSPKPAQRREDQLKSYITDKAAADFLVSQLVKDLQSDDLLIEIDSGAGILTEKLLQATNNKLLLFKPKNLLLNQLKENYPFKMENVSESSMDIHGFYKYFYTFKNQYDLKSLPKFLETINSNCKKTSTVKIVGTVSYTQFFYRLMMCYVYQCSLYQSANPTLYIFVPFSYYAALFKSPKAERQPNWRIGIVTKLCFIATYLGSIDKSCFKVPRLKSIYREKNDPNSKKMFLIKLQPKDHNYTNQLIGRNISELLFFINYLIRVRLQSSLIPSLEQLIPNCGEKFIKNGIDVYCHPMELSVENWLNVFQIFTSLPEYEASVFQNEMKKVLSSFGDFEDEWDEEYD